MAASIERPRAGRRVSLGARLALGALALGVPGLISGACVIPDRTFEAGGVDCPAPSVASDGGCVSINPLNPRCEDYCNGIESKCVGTDAVYADRAQCLAVCNALPPGADGDTTGNSVACRLALLENAETTICPQVGPIGNGRCGDNCDAYCGLRRAACQPLQPAIAEFNLPGYCEDSCEQLTDTMTYSTATFDLADTQQCRVGHLAIALTNPEVARTECDNSNIVPQNRQSPCLDPLDAVSLADDREIYCRVVLHACREFPAYESLAQCLQSSETFERGVPNDFTDNTLRCRRYHALNALADPNTHCSHAGPAGDGHCATVGDTGNCTSYCRVLSTACGDAFATEYNQDIATCVQSCSALPDAPENSFGPEPTEPGTPVGPPRYTADPNSPPPPGTLKCRTLHAVRALAAPNGPECASALAAPGSECEPDTADPQ